MTSVQQSRKDQQRASLLAPSSPSAAGDDDADAPPLSARLAAALAAPAARRLYVLLLVAAAAHAALLGGGLTLVGGSFVVVDPELGPAVLNSRNAAGVALFLAGVVLCPLPVGLALLQLAQLRAAWARPHSLRPLAARALSGALAAALCAACAYLAAFAWTQLVRADQTFNQASPPDALRQLLGGALFAAYVVVTALAACIAVSLAAAAPRPLAAASGGGGGKGGAAAAEAALRERRRRMNACGRLEELVLGVDPLGRPHQPDGLLFALPGVASLLTLLAGAGGAACLLTCIWNFQATSYMTSSEPAAARD